MNTDKYFDTIEQYFEGQMSPQEAADFEAEIERNPALKTSVENYEIANDAIELLVEKNLRAELEEWQQEADTDQIKPLLKGEKNEAKVFKMRTLVRNLSIAASVALVIGFFTFQMLGNQYSNENLMSTNYGEINFSTIRGENPDAASNSELVLEEATTAWANNNYDRAIELVEGISPTDEYFAKAQYILGHSFYQKGEFKKAQTAFETTATQQNEKYTEKAQWYEILAAIGANESELIINNKLDSIIADKGHAFEQKALDLKADLNSFWR